MDKSSVSVPFASVVNGIAPAPTGYDVVKVEISSNTEVIRHYITAFVEAIRQTLSVKGGAAPEDVLSLVPKYLAMLIEARVSHCNPDVKRNSISRHDRFAVPSFLAQFLAQVGTCINPSIGVELRPVLGKDTIDPSETLSANEIAKVSNFLLLMENHGFEMTKGLPKSSEGSWETMSMELAESTVKAVNNAAHPSHAVIAAFFHVTGFASVMGAQAFRVSYISTSRAQSLAYDIVK